MPHEDAVLVGANWYRFSPSERIVNPHVMSVSFVWGVAGTGEIDVGGRTFHMDPQQVLRMPWNHRVEYRASARGPFHIGTIHVVPRHARTTAVVPRVAHLPGDPLLHDPVRSGVSGASGAFAAESTSIRSSAARRITDYGVMAIERFGEEAYEENYFRILGRLILLENDTWAKARDQQASVPGQLDAMMRFIRENISAPLTVPHVAQAASCSPATAQRLFSLHTGFSVQEWIRRVRLREAAALLRSTSLRVGEIAHLVGYADPLYFSRVFRREFGVAPRSYAQSVLRP